jgi:hypothetical protein
MDEIRPRHYLTAYLKANGDRNKEREALVGCPEEWQNLVKTHIKIQKGKNNERAAKQSNQGSPAKRL